MTMLDLIGRQNILGNTEMGNPIPSAISPDISPSDYYLFRTMTHGLSEQKFSSYEGTKK